MTPKTKKTRTKTSKAKTATTQEVEPAASIKSTKEIVTASVLELIHTVQNLSPEQKEKIIRNASIAFSLISPFLATKGKRKLFFIGAGVLLDRLAKKKV